MGAGEPAPSQKPQPKPIPIPGSVVFKSSPQEKSAKQIIQHFGPAPMMISNDGQFVGYASIFSEPDQGGDVVMPGAFAKSLNRTNRTSVRLLFQHDPKEPIGKVLSVGEDQNGLRVEGQLVPKIERARELIALISQGALNGLSIGFRTVKATRDKRTGMRHLLQIDLWEISIVTFPMMERARIVQISNHSSNLVRKHRSPQQKLGAAISLLTNQ